MTQPLQSSEIVETSLNEHDKKPEEEDEGVFSINLSGQSSKLEISSTETGEVNEDAEGAAATGGEPTKVESGDQEDEEKKFGESTSASASHPPKRGLGSGTGKASKVASATESTSGKRHAASAASESGDNKSKDSSDVSKSSDQSCLPSFISLFGSESATLIQQSFQLLKPLSGASPSYPVFSGPLSFSIALDF